MKRLVLALAAVLALRHWAAADVYDEILPAPQCVTRSQGTADASALAAPEVARGRIPGAPENVADQAYAIEISPGGVRVTAGGAAGERYARVTLAQMRDLAQGGRVPCARIEDWPALEWRGIMNDCGRNFLDMDGVLAIVDVAAKYKMNLFHWHLSDYQGWRLESKIRPGLTAPETMMRQIGRYYSQDDFRKVVAYAKERGVTVMPELDVPGHSLALRKGLKVSSMKDPGVKEAVSELYAELCTLATPEDMPFVHIGTDEVRAAPEFVEDGTCSAWAETLAANRRKCVVWAPGIKVSSSGEVMVDMAYHDNSVTNNSNRTFDAYGMYFAGQGPELLLNMFAFRRPCSWDIDGKRKLGAIACCWHDDNVGEDTTRLFANATVFPAILGFADNFWHGRAENLYPEKWQFRLPPHGTPEFDFARALELRIVAQRDKVLKDFKYAFPYVAQTDQRWRISWADGRVIDPDYHGGLVEMEAFVTNKCGDAVAETWVWSPEKQTAKAWIGFTVTGGVYSRQHDEPMPEAGQWSKYGSSIEINGKPIPPPAWKHPGARVDWSKQDPGGKSYRGAEWSNDLCETPLEDEWYYIREPTPVELEAGWNHVKLLMPHPEKTWGRCWRGIFRLIDGTTAHPRELRGIRFSSSPGNG